MKTIYCKCVVGASRKKLKSMPCITMLGVRFIFCTDCLKRKSPQIMNTLNYTVAAKQYKYNGGAY